jgi:hypothetical protein
MKIRCRLGNHKFLERKRVELDRDNTWHKSNAVTRKKIPGTEFAKVTYIVVEECGWDDECKAQKAFQEVRIEGGSDDGKIESRVEIHPSMAKEKVFVDSL